MDLQLKNEMHALTPSNTSISYSHLRSYYFKERMFSTSTTLGELIPLPLRGKSTLCFKGVYSIKCSPSGTIDQLKALMVT